jgi:UDP-N-acetylmuramoylalanine--D-glutamate ligase
LKPKSQSSFYAGRNAVVLGIGRSGVAAARLLVRSGAKVALRDSGESPRFEERAAMLRAEGIEVILGKNAEAAPAVHDLVVLSPGIAEDSPLVVNAVRGGKELIGETELAFSLCDSPVVAITGTNGKTTTTELTVRMLRGAGLRAEACGNIGTPMSEVLLAGGVHDVLVAEVSSFQLETIRTFRPKVALWLNLSPNHLDRYPSMTEYRNAKLRIFEYQTDEDWAVIPKESELPGVRARTITFSTRGAEADLTLSLNRILHKGEPVLDLGGTRLAGPHNAANLMAAFGAGIALGADLSLMARSVGEYTPPAHRCEFIAERAGVRWINDSKATNLDAMEQAILSVEGPLVLIAGGKDKGFEFSPIASLVGKRVTEAIVLGEMRHRIARDWALVPVTVVESLEEAVEKAAALANPGTTVLFSPGTSSFDMFRDYIRRGEAFRGLVEALPDKPNIPAGNTAQQITTTNP